MMRCLRLINHLVAKAEEYIIAWGILCMFFLLVTNVLMRTFLSKSIVFSEEGGQMLLTIITFVGFSYVTRNGKHIRMSAIYDHVGEKTKKLLACLISLITSISLFWMSYVAFKYMWVLIISKRVTPALHIPVYLVIFIVVLGLFSSAIQYLTIFILNLKNKDSYIGTYLGAENSDF